MVGAGGYGRRAGEAGSWQPDGWGVSMAAEFLHDARSGGGRVVAFLSTEGMAKSHALAIALAEHLGRLRLSITEPVRGERRSGAS